MQVCRPSHTAHHHRGTSLGAGHQQEFREGYLGMADGQHAKVLQRHPIKGHVTALHHQSVVSQAQARRATHFDGAVIMANLPQKNDN